MRPVHVVRSWSASLAITVFVASCNIPLENFHHDDASLTEAIDAGDASVDVSPTGPSCANLPATCGANGSDSCCTSPLVTAGVRYFRGYDGVGDASSGDTTAPAMVSNFRLDKYEVTVGRFRAFVAAGMGTKINPPSAGAGAHVHLPASGWDPAWNASLAADTPTLIAALNCSPDYQTWTDNADVSEPRPMNCITWYEAFAFCAWDGGYLPTDAEWNYAAAGGDEQRAYPWSTATTPLGLDHMHASFNDGSNCVGGCKRSDLLAVGSLPAGDGRWGQSDLAGNVWERTLDWYGAYPRPCVDCANLTPTSYRVFRGGSFVNKAEQLRTAYRSYGDQLDRNYIIGVRCARPI